MKIIHIKYLLVLFAAILMFLPAELSAQVESKGGRTRDGSFLIRKDLPVRTRPHITGMGRPVEKLFVVQLARFEEMPRIPSSFPKGSILWINPDYPNEKFLLIGFYDSLAKAKEAAEIWKQNAQFKDAFARSEPFFVRYD